MNFNKGTVTTKTLIADKTYRVEFQPEQLIYPKAGQFISIEVGPQTFRSYSLSGKFDDRLEIVLDTVHGGPGSKYFETVSAGDEFNFLGPIGKFQLSRKNTPKVFISTGTGIGPLKFMIDDELMSYNTQPVRLIFGVKDFASAIFSDFFEKKKNEHSRFDFAYCISRQEVDQSAKPYFTEGRVTDYIEKHHSDFPKESEFYICGSVDMINDTSRLLLDKGFPPESILLERW